MILTSIQGYDSDIPPHAYPMRARYPPTSVQGYDSNMWESMAPSQASGGHRGLALMTLTLPVTVTLTISITQVMPNPKSSMAHWIEHSVSVVAVVSERQGENNLSLN